METIKTPVSPRGSKIVPGPGMEMEREVVVILTVTVCAVGLSDKDCGFAEQVACAGTPWQANVRLPATLEVAATLRT